MRDSAPREAVTEEERRRQLEDVGVLRTFESVGIGTSVLTEDDG